MSVIHRSSEIPGWNSDTYVEPENSWCPVCLSPSSPERTKFKFESTSIVECEKCAALHLYPLPTSEFLEHIYNNNYYNDQNQTHGYYNYASEEALLKKTYARRLDRILKTLDVQPNKQFMLHEIGCALGIGLQEMAKLSGAEVSGSDISQDAESACAEKGLAFYRSDQFARHSLSSGKKDLVIIFDVVEHLTNFSVFREFLNELVAPGGYVAITTPNFDGTLNRVLGRRSPSIKIPQHTIYFSSDTLNSQISESFNLVGELADYQYVAVPRLIERLSLIINVNMRLDFASNWTCWCQMG